MVKTDQEPSQDTHMVQVSAEQGTVSAARELCRAGGALVSALAVQMSGDPDPLPPATSKSDSGGGSCHHRTRGDPEVTGLLKKLGYSKSQVYKF